MAVNTYECLFLLDPNKASADFNGVAGQVNGLIERHGGEILGTSPWGDPKLAYPIKKFRKGLYLLTYFRADANKITAFEHDCRLLDTLLRHMLLKLHPAVAESVIAHFSEPHEGREGEEQHQEDEAVEE